MADKNAEDPTKKHWIIILVVLPIILALIGILPNLLGSTSSKESEPAQPNYTVNVGDDSAVQFGDGNTLNVSE